MDIFRKIAERKIEESISEGLFDNLPGAGSPLRLEDDSFVPEDLRLACRVLRNAGFTPPEVELKKEILNLKSLMKGLACGPGADAERLRRLRELNMKLTRLSVLLKRPVFLEEYEDRLTEKYVG